MSTPPALIVVGTADADEVALMHLDEGGAVTGRRHVTRAALPAHVAGVERETPRVRWVWSDTARWYPPLLSAGVRVGRCHDLRLCHAILRDRTDAADPLRAAIEWDAGPAQSDAAAALFAIDDTGGAGFGGPPHDIAAAMGEHRRQRTTVAASPDPRRTEVLCAAESAGALVAAELTAAGVPWDAGVHDEILVGELGERPPGGGAPARIAAVGRQLRDILGDQHASLDSPARLLRSLHRVGVPARTTSRWELREYDHPIIAPLLEYKRMMRLYTANGWSWLREWVHDGRFRPVYIPAGVVTGRWASSGGGALQIPRRLRPAVRADPGWTFVVADVAQLEPRVLAAMSRDTALADAARGRDLYGGVVEAGAVGTRAEAKVAMLGAMYGATTGESGRLVPRLRRAYPRAMALVDAAARTGEDGGTVTTWLGRASPPAPAAWLQAQAAASDDAAGSADRDRARRAAGDRGRFTRNFVVQGTAAEWALAWLGEVRMRLRALDPVPDELGAARSGPAFARVPHLAFFLHDEIIVHTPMRHAEVSARIVADAAAAAARMLFGAFPLDFPLEMRTGPTGEKG